MKSYDEICEEGVRELIADYGEVPPPWVLLKAHPASIGWRMGSGEGILANWNYWWWKMARFREAEKLAYFRRWPTDFRWLAFLMDALFERRYRMGYRRLDAATREGMVQFLTTSGLAERAPYEPEDSRGLRIMHVVNQYGVFPPPWVHIAAAPDELAWRTKGGLKVLEDFETWWREQKMLREQRIAFFKAWPAPASWLDFVILRIGPAPVRRRAEVLAFADRIGLGGNMESPQP